MAILFLGDVKSPAVIGLSMVVSIIISFLFFYLFNMSLNIISLSGLILALGMMIDSSIIVTENIAQYRAKGDNLEMCIRDREYTPAELINAFRADLTTNRKEKVAITHYFTDLICIYNAVSYTHLNLFYDKKTTRMYCALSGLDQDNKKDSTTFNDIRPCIGELPTLDTMLTIQNYIFPENLPTKYSINADASQIVGFSSSGSVSYTHLTKRASNVWLTTCNTSSKGRLLKVAVNLAPSFFVRFAILT